MLLWVHFEVVSKRFQISRRSKDQAKETKEMGMESVIGTDYCETIEKEAIKHAKEIGFFVDLPNIVLPGELLEL